jgi:hypothetical protein
MFKNQYVNVFWSCISLLAYVGISLQLVWLLITSLGFDYTTIPLANLIGNHVDPMGAEFSFLWLNPVFGVTFLSDRYLKRKANLNPELHSSNKTLLNNSLVQLLVYKALLGMTVLLCITMFFNSGFYAGLWEGLAIIIATGSGATMKAFINRKLPYKWEFVFILFSTSLLFLSSWIARSSDITVYSTIIQGGYSAPLLAVLLGLFLPDEKRDA